jgi:uncharacterized membrane protein YbaN (DUF454 family)
MPKIIVKNPVNKYILAAFLKTNPFIGESVVNIFAHINRRKEFKKWAAQQPYYGRYVDLIEPFVYETKTGQKKACQCKILDADFSLPRFKGRLGKKTFWVNIDNIVYAPSKEGNARYDLY